MEEKDKEINAYLATGMAQKTEDSSGNQFSDAKKKTGMFVQMNNTEKRSLILAIRPFVILGIGFLLCLSAVGGKVSDTNNGVVFWFFVVLTWLTIPIAFVTNTISIIYTIKALSANNKSIPAWIRIGTVSFQFLLFLLLMYY